MIAATSALALLCVSPDDTQPAAQSALPPGPAWKALGKDLWFDPKQRVLIIQAHVALREGALEHLLCRDQTKEHESILATAAEPRRIHAGLLLTGANVGHPVRFQPKFEPPAGSSIRIDLEWRDAQGKLQRADARSWVQDEKTGKPLARDWVFAGSQLIKDEKNNQVYYSADGGDLITVANFMSSILDVPEASSANDAERTYVAATKNVPPRGTPVRLYLRPERSPSAR